MFGPGIRVRPSMRSGVTNVNSIGHDTEQDALVETSTKQAFVLPTCKDTRRLCPRGPCEQVTVCFSFESRRTRHCVSSVSRVAPLSHLLLSFMFILSDGPRSRTEGASFWTVRTDWTDWTARTEKADFRGYSSLDIRSHFLGRLWLRWTG